MGTKYVKPTDYGSVPSDWEKKKISDICELVTDGTHNPPERVKDGIPLLSSQNIKNGEIDFTESPSYISKNNYRDLDRNFSIKNSDILLTVVGTLGRSALVNRQHTEKPFTIQRSIALLRPDRILPKFLYYVTQSAEFKRQVEVRSKATAQSGLYLEELRKIIIPLPRAEEQRCIADILSTIDEQIQETDEIIEETKGLKKGLMQDILIGGLSNESTQEIQIGPRTFQIPDHWNIQPCGQLFEAINGRVFKTEEWEEDGTQIVRIQDLRPDAEAETNHADFEVDDKYHVTDGDLLFCWAGNIKTSLGAYIWSGDDSYLNQHIYNLCPKKELDRRFFKYSLNKYLRLLKTMVGGSAGQVHITKADFEAFKLPVPPVDEQERIANIIRCVEKKIEEENSKKTHLQDLKRGLMQDLLTGKVRVNTD